MANTATVTIELTEEENNFLETLKSQMGISKKKAVTIAFKAHLPRLREGFQIALGDSFEFSLKTPSNAFTAKVITPLLPESKNSYTPPNEQKNSQPDIQKEDLSGDIPDDLFV